MLFNPIAFGVEVSVFDILGNFSPLISSISPSPLYWLAAKQYAEKTLKPMLATGKTTMLNVGMGYDATTNDDLIQDAILKFGTRYSYFVSKFNEINSSNISTPEEKVSEFNRINCCVFHISTSCILPFV